MDEILAEIRRIVNRLRRAARPLMSGDERGLLDRLEAAADEVGRAWCGGYLGYHSMVYKADLRPCSAGDYFDLEWGTGGPFSNQTRGEWAEFTPEAIEAEVYARAGMSSTDVASATDAARATQEAFEAGKKDLLPLLDALLAHEDDATVRDVREKAGALRPGISMERLAEAQLPTQLMTRDMRAMQGGRRVPPHMLKEIWVKHTLSRATQCEALADLAEHARRYLVTKAGLAGTKPPGSARECSLATAGRQSGATSRTSWSRDCCSNTTSSTGRAQQGSQPRNDLRRCSTPPTSLSWCSRLRTNSRMDRRPQGRT